MLPCVPPLESFAVVIVTLKPAMGNCEVARFPLMSGNDGCAALNTPVAALYAVRNSCSTAVNVCGPIGNVAAQKFVPSKLTNAKYPLASVIDAAPLIVPENGVSVTNPVPWFTGIQNHGKETDDVRVNATGDAEFKMMKAPLSV